MLHLCYLIDGVIYTVQIKATDRAGLKVETSYSFSVNLSLPDTEKPEISFNSPSAASLVADPRPRLEVRFFDAASGLNKDSLKINLADSRGMPQELEGLNRSSSDEKTAFAITYPSIDLAPGSYVLSASVSDLAVPEFNSEEAEMTFTVIVGLPEPVVVVVVLVVVLAMQ